MSNWLELLDLWGDTGNPGNPSIYWNEESGQYEILTSPDEEFTHVSISMVNDDPPVEDGVIAFNYVSGKILGVEGATLYINIVDENNEIVFSQAISNFSEGQISVPTVGGMRYTIVFADFPDGTEPGDFYDIDLSFIAASVVETPETPEPTLNRWWFCIPKTTPVPPVRPEGFILLKDYDVDFKYPLGSSRVLAPKFAVPMEEGCQGCGPEVISVDLLPINTKLPVIAPNMGTEYICGPQLITSIGEWLDSKTLTFTYQWYHDEVAVEGATTQIYENPDHSGSVYVKITATAPNGKTLAVSSAVVELICE